MVTERGRLVISLDTEIIWGWLSYVEWRKNYYPLFDTAQEVILRLIKLFDKYNISVTWAIVGRLVERKENHMNFFKSPLDLLFPELHGQNYLKDIPENYFYMKDLIEAIKNASTEHDIGSHTFNHLYTSNLSEEGSSLFLEDCRAQTNLFAGHDITLKSLVFPQNQVAFTNELKKTTIEIYRGIDIAWYMKFPLWAHKVLRHLDAFLPITPDVFDIKKDKNNVSFINGSLLFKRNHIGYKKHVSLSLIKWKAKKGLERAVKEGKIFHLWFHPFNFSYQEEAHFEALEEVLQLADKLRREEKLSICTMSDLLNTK